MGSAHRLGLCACPFCDHPVSRAMLMDHRDDERPPEPGDPVICAYCGGVGVFTPDRTVRRPTGAEAIDLFHDPDVLDAMHEWHRHDERRRLGLGDAERDPS